jgi:hypothetical protein
VTAEPPFQALGDVLSLRTQTVSIEVGGKTEQRLALFAEIEALDPLVAMNKAGQKLYTSIEISPNFAGTNKAYLVGLAVTDSPASLGTEMLAFAAAQGTARRCAGARSTRPTCSRWPRSSSSNWPTRQTPIRPLACWADRPSSTGWPPSALPIRPRPPRHRPRREHRPSPVPTRRPLPRWARP